MSDYFKEYARSLPMDFDILGKDILTALEAQQVASAITQGLTPGELLSCFKLGADPLRTLIEKRQLEIKTAVFTAIERAEKMAAR